MRKLLITLLLLIPAVCMAQGTGACPSGMTSVWACSAGLGDGSNSEVGLYWPGNLSLSGGALTFTETSTTSRTISGFSASADAPVGGGTTCSGSGNPGTYTCTGTWVGGRILTSTFNQQYGDWQIKAKLGLGWPAIWLLQNNGGANNCQANYLAGGSGDISPNCAGLGSGSMEIDIAEGGSITTGSTSVAQNGYFSGFNNTAPNIQITPGGLSAVNANYHIYEVIVTNTSVTFFIDGVQTGQRTGVNYNANFFLQINMAAFAGFRSSVTYPNTGSVDWVKVCTSACSNGITAAPAANGSTGFNGNGFDDFTGATLTSITVSPSSLFMSNGQTQTATATCAWSDGTTVCPTLNWTSTNTAVATVNSASGLITGVAVGASNITASANSVTSNTITLNELGGLQFVPFQGYGANATGGTHIVHVTTLSATGAGSLNACASVSGNYCVFDVSGTITASSGIYMNNNVTIDGFSSPTGITISGGDTTVDPNDSSCVFMRTGTGPTFTVFNAIVQGLRFRNCTAVNGNTKSIEIFGVSCNQVTGAGCTHDVVVDHNEFISAADEAIGWSGAYNGTFSWNLVHNREGDSGCMLVANGSRQNSVHHNYFSGCWSPASDSRIPLIAPGFGCNPAEGSCIAGQVAVDIGIIADVEWNVAADFTPFGFISEDDNRIWNKGNWAGNYLDMSTDTGHLVNQMVIANNNHTVWYLAGNAALLTPVGQPGGYYVQAPYGVAPVTSTNAITCTLCVQSPTILATPAVTGPCLVDTTASGRVAAWQSVINSTGVIFKYPDDPTSAGYRAQAHTPTTALFNSNWNKQTGSCSGATLVSITLTPASASIPSGTTKTLTAACLWSDTTTVCPTLSWASSATSAATVNSSGIVTGIANGLTNITATANSITSNAVPISVTAPNAAQPPSIFAVLVSPK